MTVGGMIQLGRGAMARHSSHKTLSLLRNSPSHFQPHINIRIVEKHWLSQCYSQCQIESTSQQTVLDCSRQVLRISIPILYSKQKNIDSVQKIAAQLIQCWTSIGKLHNHIIFQSLEFFLSYTMKEKPEVTVITRARTGKISTFARDRVSWFKVIYLII